MSFTFFHNDWFDYSNYINYKTNVINTNLNQDFFSNLKLDNISLEHYRKQSAIECAKHLGNNPALCFSGGIDSQAMIQCFAEAGLNFDIITLVFDEDLNSHDVEHARHFAKTHNYNLKEVNLDVIKFLSRENFDYGLKYMSASPHFNVHFKLFNMLKDMGYTSVVTAGNFPMLANLNGKNMYGLNYGLNCMAYLNYSLVSNFYCQGNFLSFYPKLCWSVFAKTQAINYEIKENYAELLVQEKYRYELKVKSYQTSGFNIIPQETKFTGFELVKNYIAEKYKDGWAFERLYRHPLEQVLQNHFHNKDFFDFQWSKETELEILKLHSQNFLSC